MTEHSVRGALRHPVRPRAGAALLRPGKALRLPSGALLVSDSGHHALAELDDDGETLLRRIGSGTSGHVDGGPRHAAFAAPQGVALVPAEVATHVGYDVVVADSANGSLRGVSLAAGTVRTVMGGLGTPWDVAWFGGRVVVADGCRLWEFDPVGACVSVLAGDDGPGHVDGPLDLARLCAPRGLAASPDRSVLWIADTGAGALRALTDGRLHTVADALGAPEGLAATAEGAVLVVDGASGVLHRCGAGGGAEVVTDGFAAPTAVVALPDDELDPGEIVNRMAVVESGADRVTVLRS